MLKLFKRQDEIDVLEKKQKDLELAKDEKTSKVNLKNNKIGAKVKRLEEKMFLNRTELAKFTEKIDLELEKNSKLIIASAEYAQKLGNKYKKTTSTKLKDALEAAEIKKDIKDIKSAITKNKKTNKK